MQLVDLEFEISPKSNSSANCVFANRNLAQLPKVFAQSYPQAVLKAFAQSRNLVARSPWPFNLSKRMSSDLREQLLQAGLVSKQQFDTAETKPKPSANRSSNRRGGKPGDKQRGQPSGRAGKPQKSADSRQGQRGKRTHEPQPKSNNPPELPKLHTDRPVTPPAGKGPRQYVMELVTKQARSTREADRSYHFTDRSGKVLDLAVTRAQQKQLADGQLAVVYPQHRREQMVLVAAEIAVKIYHLAPDRLASWHHPELPARWFTGPLAEPAETSKTEPTTAAGDSKTETEVASEPTAAPMPKPDEPGSSS